MSHLRWIRQRFWLCLGLAMVIAGGTAATMGYVAVREAKSRPPAIVVTPLVQPQPTTKKVTARATARRTLKSAGATTRRTGSVAVARKPVAAPSTRRAMPVTSADANITVAAAHKWRGMMWWGCGAFFVGLMSVAYSIYERPPKLPTSGADELLNDAPPF